MVPVCAFQRQLNTQWPEFQELQSTLAAYFAALTDRVIEQALEVKAGEAEEQQQAVPQQQLLPQEHQTTRQDQH